jgi:alginate O-acetyltransferase complex protein AlgI
MLFTSSSFLILLGITFIVYYLPFLRRWQTLMLIIASLIFYAWEQPYLLILLLGSISFNTLTTQGIYLSQTPNQRKLIAVLGVSANLGLLALFKYFKLIFVTVHGGLEDLTPVEAFLYYLPLPVGISFYTFEGISLLLDVFRSPEKPKWIPDKRLHFWYDTTLFVSFFPHLVAGPILKAHEFYPQINNQKKFTSIPWVRIFETLLTGYFLKMVIADNLKDLTYQISYPAFLDLSAADLWLRLLGYSMQIFADFAGYSLIAIGLADLFGYKLPDNFRFPYIAKSFSEFWTRWHISLSSWLKEYLYFSLGGNRKGKVRTYINLMLVMLLGGMWHGGAWSFMVWGGFHGLVLVIERGIQQVVKLPNSIWVTTMERLLVFTGVSFAWLLFVLTDFSQALLYFKATFTHTDIPFVWGPLQVQLVLYSLPVIIYHLLYLLPDSIKQNQLKMAKPIFYGTMLFLLLTNAGVPGSFIYFRF